MTYIASEIVEACIFKFEGNRPLYLLLHRTKTESIYPDIWQFVSGSMEQGERAADAALREILEETGLAPIAFWLVPKVLSFYDPGWDSVNLVPFFLAQVDPKAEVILSPEHTEYQWRTFEEAMKMLVWPEWKEGLLVVHETIVRGEPVATLTRLK